MKPSSGGRGGHTGDWQAAAAFTTIQDESHGRGETGQSLDTENMPFTRIANGIC